MIMPDTLDPLRSRVQALNGAMVPTAPKSVLYIMSRDCRVATNHALLAAQQHALKAKLPLVVAFVVYDKPLGYRAQEHIRFLLEGLRDVEAGLKARNVSFVLRTGSAATEYAQLVADFTPAAVYFDFSPLRHARKRKDAFAGSAQLPVYVVDAHNIVPVWVASNKQEVGARTLRPKIHHYLPEYVRDDIKLVTHPYSFESDIRGEPLGKTAQTICSLYPSNGTDVSRFQPGEHAAQEALADYIENRLHGYAANRNDPAKDSLSELSPYLHYGQLSSLSVALAVYEAVRHDSSCQTDEETLIEEMVVRKELADNFCYYNHDYDHLSGAPDWAQKTLAKHAADPREFTYTRRQFEAAETHDPAWNAAQLQLTRTGKIHGYMRMYWAKKVLEWSVSPQKALETLLYLNDFYHLDGGDPNGYVGIMWSIAGVHDRPWGERPVYGVIRSMVYTGLKRKFNVQMYIDTYSN